MRVNRPIDQWLLGIDRGLKTMTGSLTTTERIQHNATNETLSDSTKASSAALMRTNKSISSGVRSDSKSSVLEPVT